MIKCERCGKTKQNMLFSQAAEFKVNPEDQYGNVCRECLAPDREKQFRGDVKARKEIREYTRKKIAEEKKRVRSHVKSSAIAYVARKSGMLMTPAALKQARADAKTYSQKRTADTLLRRLLKERTAALKDTAEEDLPKELRFDPKDFEFLIKKAAQREASRKTKRKKREEVQEEVLEVSEGKLVMPEKAQLTENSKLDLTVMPKRSTEEEVQREMASRVLARRRLLPFIKRVKGNYQAGWVHHDICRRLEKFVEDVEAGKGPRLMLFMPPRHGKSLIASDMFPSWVLGKHPSWEIIAASYAVSLPIDFSRNIRDRMKDEAYQQLFPQVTLSPDSQSAERWKTRQDGGYVAAGIGGGITGKGADIFIIDDPIKDAQEADSETVRNTAWNWWGSTAYTRLSPKSGVLVIQTRWHDDDLSGRMIMRMKEQIKEGAPEDEIDTWEIIEYPALATETEWLTHDGKIVRRPEREHEEDYLLRKKNEALHQDRFPYKRLMQIKRQLQPRHWSALYQQNPMPDEGEYFQKSMFRYAGSLPPLHHMKIYAAFDLAIGEKQQNDYTVGIVGGLDFNDQLYVFDVLRFKGDSFKIVEAILGVYEKYRPELIGIEKGQLELAIKPILTKRMRERRLFPTLAEGDKALVPITDKLTRARPLQGRMQQGMVYFLNTQPWLETLEHELLRFPGGVHDDMVDAMAWLTRLTMGEQPPKKPTPKEMEKSWRKKLGQYVGEGNPKAYMGV